MSGAEAIKAQFKNGFIMPAFELEEPSFRQIETGSDGQLMVLGEYTLYPSEQAEVICTAKQRATFCYRQENVGFRLYHMHVSNEYTELVGDEIFPVQVSRQTYQYVQRLLKESAKKDNRRLAVKENGSVSFIEMSMIQCIQALERESILHLVNEKRQVQTSIKELEPELPSCFYRLHRSYFVNCNYVAKYRTVQTDLDYRGRTSHTENAVYADTQRHHRNDTEEKSKRALTWNKRTTGKGKSSCFCIVK